MNHLIKIYAVCKFSYFHLCTPLQTTFLSRFYQSSAEKIRSFIEAWDRTLDPDIHSTELSFLCPLLVGTARYRLILSNLFVLGLKAL